MGLPDDPKAFMCQYLADKKAGKPSVVAENEEIEMPDEAQLRLSAAKVSMRRSISSVVAEKVVVEKVWTEDQKKKLKKVIKEGGKRGVEIEGAADMGGLQFFCC